MRSSHNGQTILVAKGSWRCANSSRLCESLLSKRRCHLVGICSVFLGLPGVGLVKAGHTWVVFGSASRDFFALEVTSSPHYSALVYLSAHTTVNFVRSSGIRSALIKSLSSLQTLSRPVVVPRTSNIVATSTPKVPGARRTALAARRHLRSPHDSSHSLRCRRQLVCLFAVRVSQITSASFVQGQFRLLPACHLRPRLLSTRSTLRQACRLLVERQRNITCCCCLSLSFTCNFVKADYHWPFHFVHAPTTDRIYLFFPCSL